MRPRIYLDNCCFNRPYDDQTNPKIRLEAQAKKNAIAQWEALSVVFVSASNEIISLAESIAQTGIKYFNHYE